jgi:hypothetical protein
MLHFGGHEGPDGGPAGLPVGRTMREPAASVNVEGRALSATGRKPKPHAGAGLALRGSPRH